MQQGRHELNFSEWHENFTHSHEIGEHVQDGSMPPFYYVWMHPNANLSAQEKADLAEGLNATIGSSTSH